MNYKRQKKRREVDKICCPLCNQEVLKENQIDFNRNRAKFVQVRQTSEKARKEFFTEIIEELNDAS